LGIGAWPSGRRRGNVSFMIQKSRFFTMLRRATRTLSDHRGEVQLRRDCRSRFNEKLCYLKHASGFSPDGPAMAISVGSPPVRCRNSSSQCVASQPIGFLNIRGSQREVFGVAFKCKERSWINALGGGPSVDESKPKRPAPEICLCVRKNIHPQQLSSRAKIDEPAPDLSPRSAGRVQWGSRL